MKSDAESLVRVYLPDSDPEELAESPERDENEGPEQSADSELQLFSESEDVSTFTELCL